MKAAFSTAVPRRPEGGNVFRLVTNMVEARFLAACWLSGVIVNTGAGNFFSNLPKRNSPPGATAPADRRARFHPADSCGQLAVHVPLQSSVHVQQRTAC